MAKVPIKAKSYLLLLRMMSFPPPTWDCRYLEDMDSYSVAEVPSKGVSLTTLLAVYPADGSEGEFRLIISGSDPITVRVQASAILPASSLEK